MASFPYDAVCRSQLVASCDMKVWHADLKSGVWTADMQSTAMAACRSKSIAVCHTCRSPNQIKLRIIFLITRTAALVRRRLRLQRRPGPAQSAPTHSESNCCRAGCPSRSTLLRRLAFTRMHDPVSRTSGGLLTGQGIRCCNNPSLKGVGLMG